MKKVLCSLFALILLVGCGSGSEKDTKKEASSITKTCTIEQNGIDIEMSATAKAMDKDVTETSVKYTISYETLKVKKEDLTEEMKSQIISTMKEQMNVSEEEGVSVDSEFTDAGLEIKTTMNEKAIQKSKEGEDASLKSFVTAMEEAGTTCK